MTSNTNTMLHALLTRLSGMESPTLISKTSPFQFLDRWLAFFDFIQILIDHSVSKH